MKHLSLQSNRSFTQSVSSETDKQSIHLAHNADSSIPQFSTGYVGANSEKKVFHSESAMDSVADTQEGYIDGEEVLSSDAYPEAGNNSVPAESVGRGGYITHSVPAGDGVALSPRDDTKNVPSHSSISHSAANNSAQTHTTRGGYIENSIITPLVENGNLAPPPVDNAVATESPPGILHSLENDPRLVNTTRGGYIENTITTLQASRTASLPDSIESQPGHLHSPASYPTPLNTTREGYIEHCTATLQAEPSILHSSMKNDSTRRGYIEHSSISPQTRNTSSLPNIVESQPSMLDFPVKNSVPRALTKEGYIEYDAATLEARNETTSSPLESQPSIINCVAKNELPAAESSDTVLFSFDNPAKSDSFLNFDSSQGACSESTLTFDFGGSHLSIGGEQVSFAPPSFSSFGNREFSSHYLSKSMDNLMRYRGEKFGNIIVANFVNGYVIPLDKQVSSDADEHHQEAETLDLCCDEDGGVGNHDTVQSQ